ncbi:MAG: hypothetical protein NT069_30220 [Planctomycetota bacterium]|nr:hypothetical protein [Planctomycetota bacterium]
MSELQGKWYYQSFCPFAADVDRTKSPPELKRQALIAGPWTPTSIMEFKTDSSGIVSGTAKLGPYEFKITGSVKPAAGNIPDGIELVVTVEKSSTVYNLRGFFLANSDHVVGSVVALSNDLGYQPAGTSGPFVLFPVRT